MPLLPTQSLLAYSADKHTSKRLPQPQSKEINDQYYSRQNELAISFTELDIIEKIEQTNIQVPFKNLQQQPKLEKNNPSHSSKINEKIKVLKQKLKSFEKTFEINHETTNLIESFIDANKKIIRNKNDKEARNEVTKLDKKLLADNLLSEEEIETIIRYCEELVDLEWQLERLNKPQENLQAEIEIPPKK